MGKLDNISVLIISSGHPAQDHRLYDKEAKELTERGADVTVIGFSQGVWMDEDVHLIALPKFRSRLERMLIQPWRCLRLALRQKAHVWHIEDAELLAIVPFVRVLRPGVRIIYDAHEDFAELLMIARHWPEWAKPILRPLVHVTEKLLALMAHGVVGATESLGEKFWNRRTMGFYNLPSSRFIRSAGKVAMPFSERRYDLVHLGTLSLARGRFLARVLEKLYALVPEAKVLVTGVNDDYWDALQEILPHACEIEGRISYGDVPIRLGNAKIGIDVHPFADRHLEVAMPTKVFEYMACGCAVVSSSLAELNRLLLRDESAAESVRLVHGDNAEDYAAAVASLLGDPAACARAGEVCRSAAVRCLNLTSEGERLADFYLKVLA